MMIQVNRNKSGRKEGLLQRLLKMSQSVGGVNSGDFDTGVHPTGTSILKYRRNQIFCTADCGQRRGGSILQEHTAQHSAPSEFLIQAVEQLQNWDF